MNPFSMTHSGHSLAGLQPTPKVWAGAQQTTAPRAIARPSVGNGLQFVLRPVAYYASFVTFMRVDRASCCLICASRSKLHGVV